MKHYLTIDLKTNGYLLSLKLKVITMLILKTICLIN